MTLPGWLRDPALVPVWDVVRERLERNGVEPRGTVTVRGLERAHRHAVSGLVGRPVVKETVRIELAQLDAELVDRAGRGLVAVVSELTGPLTDRLALRSERDAARQAPLVALRDWLAEHPSAERPWTEEWLAVVRSSGLLSRVATAAVAGRALQHAAAVAAEIVGEHDVVARNELAARHTGDAHALDDGSVCGALVLRALAVAAGAPPARTPAERRALWEAAGVVSDSVSTTVLTLGLRASGGSPLAVRLRTAADAGDPVHLTGWDVARAAGFEVADVLVCENPRVLEAAALRHGGRVALVCSAGMPSLVAVRLLRLLAAAGCGLRYHGDFDWPGIAIANRLAADVGCRPWRMDAAHYLAGIRDDGLPLAGTPVEPSWDARLGEQMRGRGLAVHEEAVLGDLLAAMAPT